MRGYNKKALAGFILTLGAVLLAFVDPLVGSYLSAYLWAGGIILGFISYKEIKKSHEKGIFFSLVSIGSVLLAFIVLLNIVLVSRY